jgi:fatty-acyl-CoA synthase
LRRFQQRFSRWGFQEKALTPVYGLSEASLAVTFSSLERKFTSCRFDRDELASTGRAIECADGIEIVSVGRPLPGFELRLVDADRREVETGWVGRVLLRGPSLMEGYLGRPEATAQALADGWLDTGDLGFIHGGELYLSGRAKDVLILRGRNHSPVDVECAVDDVKGVRTGCAVAASFLPEQADGEELVLLLEARKGVRKTEYARLAREAARAVRAAVGLDPDHIEVLTPGTLPRTSSGKLRRREALHRWRRGELTPPTPVTALRVVGALAFSSLALARARRSRGRG